MSESRIRSIYSYSSSLFPARFLAVLLGSGFLIACQSAPTTESIRKPASTGVHLAEMEKLAFENVAGINTDSLLIYKDGKLLYSRYARGYDEKTKHLSWSMGKTIGGLIAAQAIDANKFSLGDPVSKWIPEYKGEAKVIDVFHMSTALAFREEYAGLPVNSDASKMLYIDGVRDGFAKYTATRAARPGVKPGDHFYYSSGDANLIMEFLKKSIGDQKTYDDYPWNAFFNRIDIPGATFEQDSHGTFVGSSYFYMTPSEYAKIGQLLANKGKWGGVQIIPAWYFAQMNQVAPGVVLNALPGTSPSRAYSMQVTTNLPIGGRGMTNSEYPDLPADSLLMIGHQGQLVIASPSENLVIVRMATDKGDPFNPFRRAFFTAIKGYLEEDFGIKLAVAGGSGPPALPAEAAGKAKFGDYFKVPKLISEFYAKEFCSCYFVVGRNEEQCRNDLKTDLPIFSIFSRINEKKKQITASFTGLKPAKAVYKGERLGCTLVR